MRSYKLFAGKYILFFIVGLLLAINLVQFKFVETKASNNYKAIDSKGGDILLHAQKHSPSARGIFSPWTTLAKIAPGSTFYLSQDLVGTKDNANFRTIAYGVAGAKYASYKSFTSYSLGQSFSQIKDARIVAISQDVNANNNCFAVYMKKGGLANLALAKISKGLFLDKSAQLKNAEFYVGYLDIKNTGFSGKNNCAAKPYLTFVDKKLLNNNAGLAGTND